MSAWPPPPLHHNPPDKPKRTDLAYLNLPDSQKHWLDRKAPPWFRYAVGLMFSLLSSAIVIGIYMLIMWRQGKL